MSISNDTLERPSTTIVRTVSGTRYAITGRRVHKLHDDGTTEEFELITGDRKLVYTDGTTLFRSSEIVRSD